LASLAAVVAKIRIASRRSPPVVLPEVALVEGPRGLGEPCRLHGDLVERGPATGHRDRLAGHTYPPDRDFPRRIRERRLARFQLAAYDHGGFVTEDITTQILIQIRADIADLRTTLGAEIGDVRTEVGELRTQVTRLDTSVRSLREQFGSMTQILGLLARNDERIDGRIAALERHLGVAPSG
jgi:hypothetical protein